MAMEWQELEDMVSLFSSMSLHILLCVVLTAFHKDLVGFQSLSLMRTTLSVETKTHHFSRSSDLISKFNQSKAALLLPHLHGLSRRDLWPSLLICPISFTAPYTNLLLCSSSRVNTRGSDISADLLGHELSLTWARTWGLGVTRLMPISFIKHFLAMSNIVFREH